MTAPTVGAYVTPYGGQWAVPCCACQRWHLHGTGDGPRASHCSNPASPYYAHGYDLRLAGEMPRRAWDRYWTRAGFPAGHCSQATEDAA